MANENASREGLGSQVTITEDMYSALQDADALVVSTDWDEFKSPDFDRLAKLMKGKVIFDGRNLYRPQQMADNKFSHYSVGRAPVVSG